MKTVFHAANSLEAHMIKDLLNMQGIEAHINGEYLQSGVGELPAINLVKISVNDHDAAEARLIIESWESQEVSDKPTSGRDTNVRPAMPGKYGYSASFLLGLAIGAIVVYWSFQSPVTQDGVDFDADGRLDERYIYKNGLISKLEMDRNFDGKIDYITYFDQAGLPESSSADDNFDGRFETTLLYQNNQVTYEKIDTNNDGEFDLVTNYQQNQSNRLSTIYDLQSGRARKEQRYVLGKLTSAKWDSDANGVMDTIITYDAYEEPTSRKPSN